MVQQNSSTARPFQLSVASERKAAPCFKLIPHGLSHLISFLVRFQQKRLVRDPIEFLFCAVCSHIDFPACVDVIKFQGCYCISFKTPLDGHFQMHFVRVSKLEMKHLALFFWSFISSLNRIHAQLLNLNLCTPILTSFPFNICICNTMALMCNGALFRGIWA